MSARRADWRWRVTVLGEWLFRVSTILFVLSIAIPALGFALSISFSMPWTKMMTATSVLLAGSITTFALAKNVAILFR